MEDPVRDAPHVIHLFTQTPPSKQREAIETYFTRDASFTHPFARVASSENSRHLILAIYRWYKIMSPRIDLEIHSIAFDEPKLVLYVNMSQTFRIWIFPFYQADVTLVTVLHLHYDKPKGKYYIRSQDDLYQVDQFVRFIPGLLGGSVIVWSYQFATTFVCLLGTTLLWPVTWAEEYWKPQGWTNVIGRVEGSTPNDVG